MSENTNGWSKTTYTNDPPEALENFLCDWQVTASRLGGISRATTFRLWRTGELPSVHLGGRRFSTARQIAAFIAALEATSK